MDKKERIRNLKGQIKANGEIIEELKDEITKLMKYRSK